MVAVSDDKYVNVDGILRFVVSVTPGGNYSSMDSLQQHQVKMDILKQLHKDLDQLEVFIQKWNALPLVMDPMYHDTVPTLEELIGGELEMANAHLSSTGSETTLALGDPSLDMGCVQSPGGLHQCRHSFQAQISRAEGDDPEPWVIDSHVISGKPVQAGVSIELTWGTPGMVMVSSARTRRSAPAENKHGSSRMPKMTPAKKSGSQKE